MDIMRHTPRQQTQRRTARESLSASDHSTRSDSLEAFLREKKKREHQSGVRSASDDESFFALDARSGLARYARSLAVSVQDTAGHVFPGAHVQEVDHATDRASSNLRRLPLPLWRHVCGVLVILALIIGLLWQTELTLISVGFWAFFVALFVWRIDARVSIGLALACLVLVPILMVAAQMFSGSSLVYWSEQAAVWAYLFLVIGVVRQMWEGWRRKDSHLVTNY